ncbi:hypothetical protein [Pyxidicoccus xibeiensis]|uniref:hypothetical protein n=1 Tax=Pyxidicoccus xibeiensis TaxID=2906759 RepID=UPI0020A6FB01|nr:hypothetical protein [Pyxidicoccus xibeiensis]MCP3142030.1 hypothetical protein [Pyxidicoccus xibeiensis]
MRQRLRWVLAPPVSGEDELADLGAALDGQLLDEPRRPVQWLGKLPAQDGPRILEALQLAQRLCPLTLLREAS